MWETCLPFVRSSQNHLARYSGKGEEDKGRQKKRWEDNIREWTGLEFAKSKRTEENRGKKWRKLGCEIICGAPTTHAVKG